jgi:pilus assembly protein CpaF
MTDLADRVRRRLVLGEATNGGGIGGGGGAAGASMDTAVRAESGGIVDDTVFARLRQEVDAELHGAGPLEPLLATPGVTDVLVNGPDSVWLDRGRGMERAAVRFADDAVVRRLAQRLAGSAGRRLDDALPFVDAVLADGTRLHAVLPPLAAHTTICLRVLARRRLSLGDLVSAGAMPDVIADLFRALIAARVAFVVTGGTGSGKTTLLGALLANAASTERLLVIEDAPELVVDHPHVVRLVCRGANVEGAGAVGLRDLVRQALRMRPDRLVVGEFRGAEVVELLVALNTGHEGGAATLHANSAGDVPARFAALGALAGLPAAAVTSLVASAIEVVVHLRRGTGGVRYVAEIGVLSRLGSELVVRPAWSAASGEGPAAEELWALLGRRAAA